MSNGYLDHVPIERSSLNSTVLGFVDLFLIHLLIDLFCQTLKFFSKSHSLTPSQSILKRPASKKQNEFDLFQSKPVASSLDSERDDGETRILCCREQVEMVMEKLGIFCHPEGGKIQESFSSSDLYEVFEENEPCREEVKAAFDVFDVNGDGIIDAVELQRVLCALGFQQGLATENCRRMLIAVNDENGDDEVDFQGFVKLLENSFC